MPSVSVMDGNHNTYIPPHCACGKNFTTDHALSCPTGGYPSIRHNELRDLTANLLREVCHDVAVEPHLQPLWGEQLNGRTNIQGDGTRLDISACGFWGGRFEKAFYDIRVFNPYAQSNRTCQLQATYRRHEQENRHQYEQKVREVERASFSPLVFAASGGMGKAATSFYKRLAALLSEKRNHTYGVTMGWLRTHVSYALLLLAILCLRGSRSRRTAIASSDCTMDLVVSEGQIHC